MSAAVPRFDRAEARRLRAIGATYEDIGTALGCSHVTANRYARDVVVETPRHRKGALVDGRPRTVVMRERRAAGETLAEIAHSLGVTRQAVCLATLPKDRVVRRRTSRIPDWVREADLADDFRDHRRVAGAAAAERHCRALAAEMGSAPC